MSFNLDRRKVHAAISESLERTVGPPMSETHKDAIMCGLETALQQFDAYLQRTQKVIPRQTKPVDAVGKDFISAPTTYCVSCGRERMYCICGEKVVGSNR